MHTPRHPDELACTHTHTCMCAHTHTLLHAWAHARVQTLVQIDVHSHPILVQTTWETFLTQCVGTLANFHVLKIMGGWDIFSFCGKFGVRTPEFTPVLFW